MRIVDSILQLVEFFFAAIAKMYESLFKIFKKGYKKIDEEKDNVMNTFSIF